MRLAFATAAAAACLAFAAPPVEAQSRQDFTMVNRTGYQINEVYVGPSSSPNWGNDVLGSQVLATGRQVAIRFPRSSNECAYDLKIIYSDGDTTEWRRINLCQISTITLTWNQARRTTNAAFN